MAEELSAYRERVSNRCEEDSDDEDKEGNDETAESATFPGARVDIA